MEEVSGFNNTGVICWFNSLLQALLSSKYFVSVITNISDNKNRIVIELKKLIQNIKVNNKVCDSVGVLQAFLIVLRHKDKNRFREFASGQQSASEGMTLLIDCINCSELEQILTHKYEERVVSINTGKEEPNTRNIGYNNQFMVFNEKALKQFGLAEYIKCHEDLLTDYRSERADADPSDTYKRQYFLKYLPKVVVILLNKYTRRSTNISLPDSFDMPTSLFNGALRYKKIAEIDHSGSLAGGHYVAKVVRGDKSYLCNDSTFVELSLGTSVNTYITIYEYLTEVREHR